MAEGALLALALLTASPEASDIVERVVAVVDQRVITMSEVERIARLEVARRKGQIALNSELPPDYLEEVRKHLIHDALLVAEATRFGAASPSPQDVDAAEAALRARVATVAAYANFLRMLPLGEDEVRDYLRRDLWVNKFIESKLRSRVEIAPADVAKYRREHPSEVAALDDKQLGAELSRQQLVQKSRVYLVELCERAEVRVLGRFDPSLREAPNPCQLK